jgi:hypothetical protein
LLPASDGFSLVLLFDPEDEGNMRSDGKVHKHIAVKVLHTSLLNITVVAFKVLPLGSYAPMPASM